MPVSRALFDALMVPCYVPAPFIPVRGEGSRIWDQDGKMYIDEAILDKPGKLTPEEFDEIKKHPQMGFELVRRMPVFSILPAHVAYASAS